jgi:PhnB protein
LFESLATIYTLQTFGAPIRDSFWADTQRLGGAVQLSVYLSFSGDCEAAFQLYERSLGGRIGPIFRYGGTPLIERVPADWTDKVMHGSITVGDQVLMGADVAPEQYEPPKGISLSLHPDTVEDAERVFGALAERGRVLAPLERPSGRSGLAWSSTASASRGWSTAKHPRSRHDVLYKCLITSSASAFSNCSCLSTASTP